MLVASKQLVCDNVDIIAAKLPLYDTAIYKTAKDKTFCPNSGSNLAAH
jgi:hypothetical protein